MFHSRLPDLWLSLYECVQVHTHTHSYVGVYVTRKQDCLVICAYVPTMQCKHVSKTDTDTNKAEKRENSQNFFCY